MKTEEQTNALMHPRLASMLCPEDYDAVYAAVTNIGGDNGKPGSVSYDLIETVASLAVMANRLARRERLDEKARVVSAGISSTPHMGPYCDEADEALDEIVSVAQAGLRPHPDDIRTEEPTGVDQ